MDAGVGSTWMGATLGAGDVFVWLGTTLGAGVGSNRVKRVDCQTEATLGVAGVGFTLGSARASFWGVGVVYRLD